MKFSIKGFFSRYNQIHSFPRIWSYLLKKSLIENFIFCAVQSTTCSENSKRLQAANMKSSQMNIIFCESNLY